MPKKKIEETYKDLREIYLENLKTNLLNQYFGLQVEEKLLKRKQITDPKLKVDIQGKPYELDNIISGITKQKKELEERIKLIEEG